MFGNLRVRTQLLVLSGVSLALFAIALLVAGGVELARRAGGSITDIQAATGRVAAVVTDISNALNEQAVATQEIARGVERIANGAEK